MEKTNQAECESPALRFLLSGDFTDFQIRAREYTFNVHRYVIASSSEYFRKLCTSSFKETQDGYLNIDEDPLLVATLIFALYTDNYDHFNELEVQAVIKNAFRMGKGGITAGLPVQSPHKFYAILFALAEYYTVSNLEEYTVNKFRAMFVTGKSSLDLNALIETIDVLYNQHPTISNQLRAIVVYCAQKCLHDLRKVSAFNNLFHSIPSFAWDLATKYRRGNWLFCSICNEDVIPEGCQCALQGLCMLPSESWDRPCECSAGTGGVKLWKCGACKETGQLVHHEDGIGDWEFLGQKGISASIQNLSKASFDYEAY